MKAEMLVPKDDLMPYTFTVTLNNGYCNERIMLVPSKFIIPEF